MKTKILLFCLLWLSACSAPALTPAPQIIRVQASALTAPWLAQAYDCADHLQLTLLAVNDPAQADLSLRFGEATSLQTPAYQIDQDDLLVVTASSNPLPELSNADVQAWFAAPGTQDGNLWVYPSGLDVQQVFVREVLQGKAISSLASVATSPRQMITALQKDPRALGILSKKWQDASLRVLYSLPGVPVLAVTKSNPQGGLQALLACLQK